MKKEWISPFWETAQKDRITVRLNITHDDGSFSTSVARVSKYDDNGNISPDFEEILDQNSLESIEKNTEDRLERHRQRRENDLKKQKEQSEAKRLEDLFNQKLSAFEITAIKKSKNRELKSKMRKASNTIEMQAYATLIIMEELNNESGTQ